MKKLLRKIKECRGESLVESIASILIFTLSSILLLSMIATSAKLNEKAIKQDTDIRAELIVAEAQEESGRTESSIQIKAIDGASEFSQNIPVYSFSSGNGTLYSFEWKE